MGRLTDNMRGALLMIGAMTAFTLNDACLKALGATLPFFQVVFVRGVATTILLALIAWRMGMLRLPAEAQDRKLVVIRAVAEVAAAYFFITALFKMPFANVSAILQATPLAVTLGAALAFGEPVGWRRLTAIGIGFGGVLLIVRPGTEGFNVYSVYVLLSVIGVVVRDLATRRMSREVPSLFVALTSAGAVALFGGVGSVFEDWAPLSARTGVLFAGSVTFIVAAYVLSVAVMRVGEIGFVAPFRYTSLIVALILGFAVFGEWPAALTLIGAAIVVGTGLFTLLRERRLARRARPPLSSAAAGPPG